MPIPGREGQEVVYVDGLAGVVIPPWPPWGEKHFVE